MSVRRATPSRPPLTAPRGGVKRPRDDSADSRARSNSVAAATPKKRAPTPPASTPAPEAGNADANSMQAKYATMACRNLKGVMDKRAETLSTLQQLLKDTESDLMRKENEGAERVMDDLKKRDAKRASEMQEVEDLKEEKQNIVKTVIAGLTAEHEQINRDGISKQQERQFIFATGEVKQEQLMQAAVDYDRRRVLETESRERKLKEIGELKKELESVKAAHTEVSLKAQLIREETEKLRAEKDEYCKVAADWEKKKADASHGIQKNQKALNLHEEERRKLHNKIEELKGNIRVFCRIRAPLASDRDLMEFDVADGRTLNVRGKERTVLAGDNTKADDYAFKYDRVFGPAASQEDVFADVSPLVQSCLDGFKVCIFAYGQTGSGKTYTMEGPNDNKGVIPRAVNMIFQKVTKLTQERGFQCVLSCSFLEIYNDQVRDLLGAQKPGQKESGSKATDRNLKISSSSDGEITVEGLTEFSVTNQTTVGELLATAQANRCTASTKMNDMSSRSHSVFMLKIKTRNPVTGVSLSGLLNLIDLAGSEKVNASEVQGQRFKEAVAINSSLTHLGDVIHALGTGGHVPYRNCTLTRLLQTSLGGSSKCLMLVNT
ncbi:Kinesin-like protein klpA, partial [Diplonema papillatum]